MAIPSFTVHLAAKASQLAAGRQRKNRAPQASVTRKDFTDRLGLPADASNDAVLAAIDAVKKPKPARAIAPVPQRSADDALYALAFGPSDATSARQEPRTVAPHTPDDELYALAFGDHQTTASGSQDDALYKAVWG